MSTITYEYIDMTKAYKTFGSYVKQFDTAEPKTLLKIVHILHTARKAREIAEELKLEQEDIELAELIGLLHDIGRFEQIALYSSFKDYATFDHGAFGVEVLYNDELGIARDFVKTDKYDTIIASALLNHNKKEIIEPEKMSDKELLHVKIIRDADKLDIFRVINEESNTTLYDKEDTSNDIMTDAVFENFKLETLIDYQLANGGAPDGLMCNLAYVFDICFDESCKIALKDKNLQKILTRHKFIDSTTQLYIQQSVKHALTYCERRALRCKEENPINKEEGLEN